MNIKQYPHAIFHPLANFTFRLNIIIKRKKGLPLQELLDKGHEKLDCRCSHIFDMYPELKTHTHNGHLFPNGKKPWRLFGNNIAGKCHKLPEIGKINSKNTYSEKRMIFVKNVTQIWVFFVELKYYYPWGRLAIRRLTDMVRLFVPVEEQNTATFLNTRKFGSAKKHDSEKIPNENPSGVFGENNPPFFFLILTLTVLRRMVQQWTKWIGIIYMGGSETKNSVLK